MTAVAAQSGNYMASLIIGGVILATEKIKAKKAAKKDAKREAYEQRYDELQKEHHKTTRSPASKLEKEQTGQTEATKRSSSDAGRRASHESERSEKIDDGPSQWVNDVYVQRSKSQSGAH